MRPILLLLPLLALAACATVTPYQPLAQGLGYAEQRIESNRYRVSYTASARTPRQAVDDYLLYRAAELTLANGHDWFVMLGKSMPAVTERGSGMSVGLGGYGGGGRGGVSIGLGTGIGDGPPWQAYADIVTYAGAKPADDPAAFDARAVRDSLAPRLAPAPPAAP